MRRSTVNPFLTGKGRPIVVGHRGVPTLHQENTLAGFRRAVALGIPAVELDVRLTADRKPVVVHDGYLERLTGWARHVMDLTWDQLSRLRIRRHVPMGVGADGTRQVLRYEREERIPLLEEVLAEVGSKLAINVELKLDLRRWWQVDIATIVADVIVKTGVQDRVIVTSFDPGKLRAASKAHPELAVGFCFDDRMLDFAALLLDRLPLTPAQLGGDNRRLGANGRRLLNWLLDTNLAGWLLGTRVVGAEHTLVGEDTVRRLHEQNVAIGTHTLFPIGASKRLAPSATSAAEVDRLVALGVDWIESDDPEKLLSLVR
jgi:glycerophosphoryl diester phosphodiesterase